MHRSIGKITDEDVVIFIINKICTAKSSYYNADNHVISLSGGRCRKTSLHTNVPISHFKTRCQTYLPTPALDKMSLIEIKDKYLIKKKNKYFDIVLAINWNKY